jgi:hypothetical protein
MTTHPALTIADEIAAVINAATLSPSVTATRSYVVRWELADLKTPRVDVVPVSLEETRIDRVSTRRLVGVDIAIQARLSSDATAVADPLIDLADSIAGLFRFKLLPSGLARNTLLEHVLYSVDDLEKHRVVKTILRLTYSLLGPPVPRPAPPVPDPPDSEED